MTQDTKRMIQEKVRANTPFPGPGVSTTPGSVSVGRVSVPERGPVPPIKLPAEMRAPTVSMVALADELVIEVTGSQGVGSVTLRPSEVNRLRGRYGNGPGFEQWVAARIKDSLVSFGGG